MQISVPENIDPATRSFTLIAIALAYPAWDVGFEFGAFGRLFFEKLFMVWSISVALLLVMALIPSKRLQLPAVAWIATGFPTVWLTLALIAHTSPDVQWLRYSLIAAGLVAYVVCLPFIVYLGISVAYPELLQNKRVQPRLALLCIVIVLCGSGYITGVNHARLLTCDDFAVSGQFVPENCHPTRERATR